MEKRTRDDYLRTIFELIREKGYARTGDIARRLGVRPSTVSEALQKLSDEGLILYERYSYPALTPEGKGIARKAVERYRVLSDFLRIIGLQEELALRDAGNVMHAVRPETLKILTDFVRFVKRSPGHPRWLEHFRYFMKTGEYAECENAQSANREIRDNQ